MSAPMPLEIGSDNIDDVRAAISEWEERCAVSEDHFDGCYRVLIALEGRLDELESAQWFAERREQRSAYYRAVI